MKKFAKMSLVAAVAVAGLTTANAKDLSEAIKGVDVSGTVVYRYNEETSDNRAGVNSTDNYYKVGITLKAPVNDDVTFTSRILMDETNGGSNNGLQNIDTGASGDANLVTELSWANFTYTGLANTSIVVGKQGLQTPWTNAVDSDGSEQTGTGVLAATTMGPVTAAAGYFNQTNVSGVSANGQNLVVAGLMGAFAGVNAEVWYLDIDETVDSVFAGLNYKFNVGDVTIGLDGKLTTADYDSENTTNDDVGQFEVGVTAKMGIINAGIAYAESDEDGALIVNSLAKNGQIGYNVNIAETGNEDVEMWMFDLGAQVTPELHVQLNYDEVEDKTAGSTADDHEETYVQITYQMSKNLQTYVRLATGEDNNVDYDAGRLQVQYSF